MQEANAPPPRCWRRNKKERTMKTKVMGKVTLNRVSKQCEPGQEAEGAKRSINTKGQSFIQDRAQL
jgi:hypothetical protein